MAVLFLLTTIAIILAKNRWVLHEDEGEGEGSEKEKEMEKEKEKGNE